VRTRVGYAGGTHADPSYHDLGDHAEAFELDFDPRVVSYAELVAIYERSARPGGRGQYRHANLRGHRFYLAEDYHQKYYLRHDRVLMQELAGYTPRQLVDSTVAARLNSFAARRASHAQVMEELPRLGLSRAASDYLLKLNRG
jgi:peptide-methionine (S)-S-oxide reductase